MFLSPLRISSWSFGGMRALNRVNRNTDLSNQTTLSTSSSVSPSFFSTTFTPLLSFSSSSSVNLSLKQNGFLFVQQRRFQSTSTFKIVIKNGNKRTPTTSSPILLIESLPKASLKFLRSNITSSASPPLASEPQPISRSPSTSSSLSSPSKVSGFASEFKALIGAYMKGAKGLWNDWKESQAIQHEKSKPKLFETIDSSGLRLLSREERDEGTMTWRELLKVHKAKANLLKALPVVTLFALPIIGNTVPLITYFFPWLLPNSFLTESQKTQLSSKIRQQQIDFCDQVVEDLRSMSELHSHPTFAAFIQAVEHLSITTSTLPSPSPSEILPSSSSSGIPNSILYSYFERGLELVLSLEGLSRQHLNSLANCLPYSATRFHIYPSALYRRNLIRAAALLYEEDVVLTRDPEHLSKLLSEELTLEELQELCESRAIHVQDTSDRKQLEKGLRVWLEFVSQLDELLFSTATQQQPQPISFPVSFYLHAVVIKNLLPQI